MALERSKSIACTSACGDCNPRAPCSDTKPINGQALADRIIASGDAPITRESRDPQSNYGYGYTEAILADVDGHNGVLQLKKDGSVRATRDGVFVTPARVPPESGRYFMNGSRYCCSCQDSTQRDYFYASTIMGERKGIQFPYSSPAALKPGRYEMMKEQMSGISIVREPLSNAAQERYNPAISGIQNREMMIVGPRATRSVVRSISLSPSHQATGTSPACSVTLDVSI